MSDEVFADNIGGIAITGSVVRIDFVSLSPPQDDARKQPKPVLRQRVVMPVEGFIQSFGVMARVMQQLEQKGLIRRNEPAGKEAEVPVPSAAKPSSPNFKPK